jgi:hypothetical protein
MSVSTEVQRTLVKSPPELWSELSNPEALARHLSELGEIRITSTEPETKVEWEAEGASGIVHLKQSGWGTKVTLSVTRAAPVGEEGSSESEAIESEAIAGSEAVAEPEPAVIEAGPIAVVEPEVETETAPEPEPELESLAEPTPEPRVGFLARLFRRRKIRAHETVEAQSEPQAAPQPEQELEIVALAAPEPIYPDPIVEPEPQGAEQASDLAAELASVEAQMTQETTELLTGLLDRLGAAHHRPFSRG